EADAERLFERLYRASDAVERQIPGAGLGLPIARAIIEAHRGSIGVIKREVPGATFRVRLPLTPPSGT
ncbi:MAG: ATP-binding protein, partial [Actinomycetota bacterium]|nr:ATP-binding protein [Actinomycetota bacterium]